MKHIAIALFIGMALASAAASAAASPPTQDFRDSIAVYKSRVMQDSSDYPAKMGLARALSFTGQYEEGIAVYREILRLNPEDNDARLAFARVLAWGKHYAEALTEAKKVTSKNPELKEAWSTQEDIQRWSKQPVLIKTETTSVEVEGQPEWKIGGGYSFESYANPPTPWQTVSGNLWRGFSFGSASVEGAGVERYGQWTGRIGLDTYFRAWSGAYGNLWLESAPGSKVLPYLDYRAEVFQKIFKTFELSGSFRQLRYPDVTAEIFGAGAGAYAGNWYSRATASLIQSKRSELSATALVRRYAKTEGSFAELRMGLGRSELPWSPEAGSTPGTGYFFAGFLEHPLSVKISCLAGARTGKDPELGTFIGMNVGASYRFGKKSTRSNHHEKP